jgi:hypothetical protein
MKYVVYAHELDNEPGKYIAMVDWFKYDGNLDGTHGTPGAIRYGDSYDEATNRLKELLESKGHEIVIE